MSMATFQRYVNTRFQFQVGGRSIALPLTRVTDERAGATTSGECFSLNFAGPKPAFGQATYRVDHASLGRFHLFVVPVGRRSDGQDYQAVFNRVTG